MIYSNSSRGSAIPEEVAKFSALSDTWWDTAGPLKTLHQINPFRVDWIASHGSLQDKAILDIGCGGGILSESLSAKDAKVTGLDASKEAIQVAKAHAKTQKLPITYVAKTIENYKPKKTFDYVTCLELLEHVAHPEKVIAHAAKLLKPGGLLFLSTINRTPRAYLEAIVAAEYLLGLLPRQTHDYDKCIRPSELATWCREAGLEVVQLVGMGYNPLTQQAYFRKSVDVNYLMVARRQSKST